MGRNIFAVSLLDMYLIDIQAHCATHNECISEVHDTIQIEIGTYL